MVVDLTLSSSDSEEDDTSLMNIKERLLNQQRALGSQSSRPSTADSVDHSTAGILPFLFILYINHDVICFKISLILHIGNSSKKN